MAIQFVAAPARAANPADLGAALAADLDHHVAMVSAARLLAGR